MKTETAPPPPDTTDATVNAVLTPVMEAIRLQAVQHAQPDEFRVATAPPADQGLPFPPPKFDYRSALESITAKNRDVEAQRHLYDRRKADAKAAKDVLDQLEEQLSAMIDQFAWRMEQAARETQQPYLAPVNETDDVLAESQAAAEDVIEHETVADA